MSGKSDSDGLRIAVLGWKNAPVGVTEVWSARRVVFLLTSRETAQNPGHSSFGESSHAEVIAVGENFLLGASMDSCVRGRGDGRAKLNGRLGVGKATQNEAIIHRLTLY